MISICRMSFSRIENASFPSEGSATTLTSFARWPELIFLIMANIFWCSAAVPCMSPRTTILPGDFDSARQDSWPNGTGAS
ncbi:hypothetical protein D3C83_92140 [compost metagenome]